MKIALFAALFFSCGLTLSAQAPVQTDKEKAAAAAAKPAAPARTDVRTAKAAAPAPAKKTARPEPAAAKPDAEAEESVVMIDSKGEADDSGRFSQEYGQDDAEAAGGIPSSYGQCKGTLNDGGRSLLVFESVEDGTISLVQITSGKNKVSWKLVDRIRRSND